MQPDHLGALLGDTAAAAAAFVEGLGDRNVGPTASIEELRAALGGPLPEAPVPADQVVAQLAASADGGLVASAGPRYFGFVFGGSVPAALAADWLTSAWDQNALSVAASPAATVVEEVCAAWLTELLGLPATASVAFVTGCQMANVTALAAARHHVLAEAGWNIENDGLTGAPPITVIVGAERHVTIDRALRILGIGSRQIVPVAADDQGRLSADALPEALASTTGPRIVCAQAGNVNTGAFDPLDVVCDLAHEAGAWVHVDSAFGLWAAVSDRHRHLLAGIERADSWATDGHKFLNVPYDSGVAVVADAMAHRAAFSANASYLSLGEGDAREPVDYTPEASRRARGFPMYAALRSLGRSGIADLVDRCCAHARRFADLLSAAPGVEVLNDVVLNQVLVRFLDPSGQHDDRTRAVVAAVQRDGTCWLGGTVWQGRAAMRISVSNWSTTADDVDRSAEAILRAYTVLTA